MGKKSLSYHEEIEISYMERLRTLLEDMPPYVGDYFRAAVPTTSARMRMSYAYDLVVFFRYLLERTPSLSQKDMKNISLHDLDRLASDDIEGYQEYLKYYKAGAAGQRNGDFGIARKMSSLRSFLGYFYKKGLLSRNAAMQVNMPKIREKAITHLEPGEVSLLLDYMEQCENQLSKRRQSYFRLTRQRDLAIVTLFLGTGIRVSECVGLDLADVNFRENSMRIRRKGGGEAILYFGPEVEGALLAYVDGPRKKMASTAREGHENALFYSLQKRRISVHAVENLVRKYTEPVVAQKRITCHKLRSTFGTALYQETGDIYLVADVLGHKDVNTTRKHYASIKDERRRKAASVIRLREK